MTSQTTITEEQARVIREEYNVAVEADRATNAPSRSKIGTVMELIESEYLQPRTEAVIAKYGEAAVCAATNQPFFGPVDERVRIIYPAGWFGGCDARW